MDIVIIVYKNSNSETKKILRECFDYFQKYIEPLIFFEDFKKKINTLSRKPNYVFSPFISLCLSGDFEAVAAHMPYYSYEIHNYGLLAAIREGLILVVITIVPRSPVDIEKAIKYAQYYQRWRICAYLLKF